MQQSHTFKKSVFLSDSELKVSRLLKRSYFEIIAEILETAKDGAKKTRIMYGANLSFRRTKRLLPSLLETGLLRLGNSYYTNKKGPQFLKAY